MKAPERRDIELNEARWWSRWARLRWREGGYLLSSDAFREPFFNRAGALTCSAVTRTAAWAERSFAGSGMKPTLVVFGSCGAVGALRESGYEQVDTMSVLVSRRPPRESRNVGEITAARAADPWTAAYLKAFYGDEELTGVVRPIVASLLKDRAVTLLESKVGGGTAGVLALFRTAGLAGVYCVGTVSKYRRHGVAAGLLAEAERIAEKEGRALVLQSLLSDGALRLYLDNGFEEMYEKIVLERKLK